MIRSSMLATFVLPVLFVLCDRAWAQEQQYGAMDDSLQRMVEADWASQEERKGRRPGDAEAIAEAIGRARLLLADLAAMEGGPDVEKEKAFLTHIESQAAALESLDEAARTEIYLRTRRLTRAIALKNPLVAGRPLVFLKRRRFICQMLHEYNGYYYDYGDIAGGGVYILPRPGESSEITDLIGGRLSKGNYTTLSLSYDAKTIYFAFAKRSEGKPEYHQAQRFSYLRDGCRREQSAAVDGRAVR